MQKYHSLAKRSRRAFTIVELLVCLSIIALLLALIMPAIMKARSAARQLDCQSRFKNLALAMQGFAGEHQRFPAAALFGATGDLQGNWVVQLLPYLDQTNVSQKWDPKRPASDPVNRQAARVSLPVLACPSDISAEPGQPNLSYVVNGGIGWTEPIDCPVGLHVSNAAAFQPLDLNGNGVTCAPVGVDDGKPTDRDLFLMLGVFFVENWPIGVGTVRHHRIEDVSDGTSQTLCMMENVRAGYDPASGDTWSSANPRRIAFYLSSYICKNGSCSPGNVDYSRGNDHTQDPYRQESINSSLQQAEGEAPWPSSYHTGGVNAVFCDGHIKFVSDLVDGRVYARLVSPQGGSIEGPLAQGPLSE